MISTMVERKDGLSGRTVSQPVGAPPCLLDVRNVVVRFGGILALQDVSFTMTRGDIVGLIGPNGAGKTTLFNCLSRLYQPASGDILFNGKSLLTVPRHEIAALGIGRTFQNVALFDKMTVADNVLVGGHTRGRSGFLGNALKLPWIKKEEQALQVRAAELLDFMDIATHRDDLAGGLPFPIRKRIEMARTLMSSPQLILLDEPAAGLNHEEVEILKAQIRRVRDHFHVTVLLVEHHMNLVMSISDKVVALNFGQKLTEGIPADVQKNEAVIQAYLGTDS
jgi:branched-chain amino acid transport system ATP-binding protein